MTGPSLTWNNRCGASEMALLLVFSRLILRPLRREPLRTALTVLAVALGVGVVVAIELAGNAAAGSFRSSVETLTGDEDFEISAAGGVPASVLTTLARLPYDLRLKPRIEDYAVIPSLHRTVPFLGVDMLTDSSSAPAESTGEPNIAGFADANAVWVGESLPFRIGDSIELLINDRSASYVVRGRLGPRSGEAIVMDLAPATEVLARDGKLDRILVHTPQDRPVEQWQRILTGALPDGVSLAPQGTRTNENRKMLEAFRWNLRVLSYIALVVGAFLIYNTIAISVVRRRAELGVLRALGATRAIVRSAFLFEALVFGLIGGAVGAALGRFIALSAVQLVASTVESLYVSSRPAPIELSFGMAVAAMLAGGVVALVSAWIPAWEASQVSPVEAMARGRREHHARLHQRRNLTAAAVLAALGGIASQQPSLWGKAIFGYAATLCLVAAAALAMPSLVVLVSNLAARWSARRGPAEVLLAAHSLRASLLRTSVLAGALCTAIAMTSAIAIMVGSFRQTVLIWMDDRLRADLYLRPAGPSGADRHPVLDAAVMEQLRRLPEVAALDPFRGYEITYDGLPATLGSSDTTIASKYGRRPFLSGTDAGEVLQSLKAGNRVVVSEAFANKHHLRKGDFITLPLGSQRVRFQVMDVYYDYSTERGYVLMDRSLMLKYLPDPAPSNLALYLKPGTDLDQARTAVERAVAGRKIAVFTNRSLRAEAIRIFDRTFAITYAMEAVAVFVAVMGVAGALLALVIDRRREMGLLRFLGGSTAQMRRLILCEAGLLGLASMVAGVVLGLLLSLILIYVINKQSFGWTIQFHSPIAVLLSALTLVYLATVLAGLFPARVAARLNPIEALHEE